jgi:hypothetical protein
VLIKESTGTTLAFTFAIVLCRKPFFETHFGLNLGCWTVTKWNSSGKFHYGLRTHPLNIAVDETCGRTQFPPLYVHFMYFMQVMHTTWISETLSPRKLTHILYRYPVWALNRGPAVLTHCSWFSSASRGECRDSTSHRSPRLSRLNFVIFMWRYLSVHNFFSWSSIVK